MSDQKFVWIDMETTGLDPKAGVPLELGFIVTDLELNEMNRTAWTIFEAEWDDEGKYEKPYVSDFVLEMHDKSELWAELEDGYSLKRVQREAEEWLGDMGVDKTDPLCGSSVQFDREWAREWFPDMHGLFSYRNIDVSTLKELMMRLSPEIYKLIETHADKRGIHRVLPDIEDTISELRFYRQEFLWVPSDWMADKS